MKNGTYIEDYVYIYFKISVNVPSALSFSVWLLFPLFSLYQGTISENNVHFESDLVFPMRSWYQMRLGGGTRICRLLYLVTVVHMQKLQLRIKEFSIVYFLLDFVSESRESIVFKSIIFSCYLILYLA